MYTDTVHEELLALVKACLNQVVVTPNDYRLDVVRSPSIVIITVFAPKSSIGVILGKGGNYAYAMRALCRSWWGRYRMRVEYTVNEENL